MKMIYSEIQAAYYVTNTETDETNRNLMSEPETPPPAPPPDKLTRGAAIAAVLAPVPAVATPTAPRWIETGDRTVDPKSLY
jgi:hypothetical protein